LKAGGAPALRGNPSESSKVVADGEALYFVPEGTTDLTAVPLLGGAARVLATVPGKATLIDVDDDAGYYVYSDVRGGSSWRQPKSGAAPTQLDSRSGGGAGDKLNLYARPERDLLAVPRDGSPARSLVTWRGNSFYHAPGSMANARGLIYYIDP